MLDFKNRSQCLESSVEYNENLNVMQSECSGLESSNDFDLEHFETHNFTNSNKEESMKCNSIGG